jgi:drug/metabolite transporter (DMT)-like permease
MSTAAVSPSVPHHRSGSAARGQFLLLVSAFAFSSAGFFTREAPVDLWAMVFWRNIFGCAALLPFVVGSKQGVSWRFLLLLGPWGWTAIAGWSFATICFLGALTHSSVANVSIIYASAPLATALIAWLWLGEKTDHRTLGAALLALLGVAITVSGSQHSGDMFGDGLALAMTLALSGVTVIARRHGGLPALPTACLSSFVTALAVLPLGWLSGSNFVVSGETFAWLAAFGVLSMAVALPCYIAGAAFVPAARAMLISALEMPLAPLWVWLAFAETPSTASLLGGGLVALAILSQLGRSA